MTRKNYSKSWVGLSPPGQKRVRAQEAAGARWGRKSGSLVFPEREEVPFPGVMSRGAGA